MVGLSLRTNASAWPVSRPPINTGGSIRTGYTLAGSANQAASTDTSTRVALGALTVTGVVDGSPAESNATPRGSAPATRPAASTSTSPPAPSSAADTPVPANENEYDERGDFTGRFSTTQSFTRSSCTS